MACDPPSISVVSAQLQRSICKAMAMAAALPALCSSSLRLALLQQEVAKEFQRIVWSTGQTEKLA